jgi:hypothetical protein
MELLLANKTYEFDVLWQLCQQYNLADDKTLRLFACYCARSVLDNISSQKERGICQKTIEVAERFAHGLATKKELEAARFAAGSAAYSAANSAAYYAAYYATYFAAVYAAGYAAYYAANAAANSAANSAAKQQYTLHLLEMVPRLKNMLVWL